MNDDEPTETADDILRKKVALLRQEHQDIDASIAALEATTLPDQLLIARLKRKKLALKDEILRVEAHILPDIIA